MEEKKELLDIVYIAGSGRSGSTLLGDILGSLQAVIHLGEFRGVFDYTIIADGVMPCSCGQSFSECEFWGRNFKEVYGDSWEDLFSELQIEGRLPRMVQLPWLAFRVNREKETESALELESSTIQHLNNLLDFLNSEQYKAIIDSSKSPSFAWVMQNHCSVNLKVVHLIRDPRATLFSWLNRPVPIPNEDNKNNASMRTRSMKEAVLAWIKDNTGSLGLKFLGYPYHRIKYEDLTSNPRRSLEELASFCQQNKVNLEFSEEQIEALIKGHYVIGERHLIGSNPRMKKSHGNITFKQDVAWKEKTTRFQKIIWTIIFLPWLILFRYPLKG